MQLTPPSLHVSPKTRGLQGRDMPRGTVRKGITHNRRRHSTATRGRSRPPSLSALARPQTSNRIGDVPQAGFQLSRQRRQGLLSPSSTRWTSQAPDYRFARPAAAEPTLPMATEESSAVPRNSVAPITRLGVAQRSGLRRYPHTALVSGLVEPARAYPAVDPPGSRAVLTPECWVPADWSFRYTPLTSIEDPHRGFGGARAG
jgi:hypothetical protein